MTSTSQNSSRGFLCSYGNLGYVHTYTFSKRFVFEKIRFWVSTHIVRQSGGPVHTDVVLGKRQCLLLKITASVFYMMYVDRDGLASSSNRTFLFVSFACQCRSSVLLHVLVPRGRSVRSLRIMEAVIKEKLQRQNETQTKDDRSKIKKTQNTRPSSEKTTRKSCF